HARRRLASFGLGLATYGLGILLSRAPFVVESAYGAGIGPVMVRILTFLTGWVPLAIGELLVLAYLSYQVRSAWRAGFAVRKGQRSLGNAVGSGTLRLLRDAGVLVTLFYLLWGFNYSRPPLEQTLGWQRPDSTSVEELAGLVEPLIRAANEEYRLIHGQDDAGTPTLLSAGRDSSGEALAAGWIAARASLGFPRRWEPSGKVKTPLLRQFYEWVGVAGFYFPFTAEPNVRGGIPGVDLGKILAHELAHQRGVAREDEANFWGFLAAAFSREPVARYSAYVFAQHQLLAPLVRADRELAATLADLRLPGVQRDIRASAEYWARTRGSGASLGTAANNAFLRTNRVEGGVRNYSRSALLFLAYARERGGRIIP
ncbi:MAG: DUF3810 domain-containing protein, partial [Longimicrobiales bacterium]